MREWGLGGEFQYRGEVDRAKKIAFLQSLDVMSVPATYAEPKGIFLLEAMAVGVPVVQPRRGAFPEILDATGGGLLVDADNPDALAEGLRAVWRDPARAAALGAAGAAGVRQHYSVCQMAETVERIYAEVIRRHQSART
jgi:glycosyltransferase involved in cell wall biosynthesis